MESGLHLGAVKNKYNYALGNNIVGHRFNVSILNLEKTIFSLKQTSRLMRRLGFYKSNFLFINYDLTTEDVMFYYAQLVNQMFLSHKWIGGFLTNYKEIRPRIVWPRINVPGMLFPKALFIVNTKANYWPLNEGVVLKLPIIAAVSSDNFEVNLVHYSLVGNDKTIFAVNFYNRMLVDSYNQGLLFRYFKIIKVKIVDFYKKFKLMLKLYSLIFIYFRLVLIIIINFNINLKLNNKIMLNQYIIISIKLLLLLLIRINKYVRYLNKVNVFSQGNMLILLLTKLGNLTSLVLNYLINEYNNTTRLINSNDLIILYNMFIEIKRSLNKRLYLFNVLDYLIYFGIKKYYNSIIN